MCYKKVEASPGICFGGGGGGPLVGRELGVGGRIGGVPPPATAAKLLTELRWFRRALGAVGTGVIALGFAGAATEAARTAVGLNGSLGAPPDGTRRRPSSDSLLAGFDGGLCAVSGGGDPGGGTGELPLTMLIGEPPSLLSVAGIT